MGVNVMPQATKRCPLCNEEILLDASVCRYCKRVVGQLRQPYTGDFEKCGSIACPFCQRVQLVPMRFAGGSFECTFCRELISIPENLAATTGPGRRKLPDGQSVFADSAAGQSSPWTPQTPTFLRPKRRVTATLVTVLVLVAAGAVLLVALVALARHGKTSPTPRTRKEAPKPVRESSTTETPPRAAKPLLPEGLSHKEDRIVRTRDRAEVIFVPAGKYLSGQDEREVIVAGFYIDKCEVTNAQFTRFLQATEYAPERLKAPDLAEREEDHPVLGVTHVDAGQYAKWAGAGLPTAREWEKAARGTDGRRYPWGDGLPKKKLAVFGRDAAKGAPDAVGAHPEGASPYGVMDLAGNALEWIANGRAMGGHYASTSRSIVVIVAPGKPAGDAGADVLFCGFRCVVRVKTAAPGDKAPDKTADAEGKD